MALLTPSNLRTVKLELNGIEEYLAKIQQVGNNVDNVVKQALEESTKPIFYYIEEWAKEHKLSGATLKGVTKGPVKNDGSKYYIEIGIDTTNAPLAWHAVFVEYGTPTNPPDPGIRKAFDSNKKLVKGIQIEILSRAGVPV